MAPLLNSSIPLQPGVRRYCFFFFFSQPVYHLLPVLFVNVQLQSGLLPFVTVFPVHLQWLPHYLHEETRSSPQFIRLEIRLHFTLDILKARSALTVLLITLKVEVITTKILQGTFLKPPTASAALWCHLIHGNGCRSLIAAVMLPLGWPSAHFHVRSREWCNGGQRGEAPWALSTMLRGWACDKSLLKEGK